MRPLIARLMRLLTKSAATHGQADARGDGTLPMASPAQHFPPCGVPRNHAEEIRNLMDAEQYEEQCNYPDLASVVRYGEGQ